MLKRLRKIEKRISQLECNHPASAVYFVAGETEVTITRETLYLDSSATKVCRRCGKILESYGKVKDYHRAAFSHLLPIITQEDNDWLKDKLANWLM